MVVINEAENENKHKNNGNVLTSKQLSTYKASTKKTWLFINSIKECTEYANKKLGVLKLVIWTLVILFALGCLVFAFLTVSFSKSEKVYTMIYCLIGFQIACVLTIIIGYIIQSSILKKAFNTIDSVRTNKGSENAKV